MSEEQSPRAVDAEVEEPHFLSVPEVAGAFDRMLSEFSRETDRGAVLIAADIVAETLGSVIEELRPEDFAAKQLKGMMRYPGLLASFSARADVAFLAGFIDANAHASIDKLRRLRNGAAHSQSAFSLADHRNTLRGISDLGPGVAAGVNRLAVDLILRTVVDNLMEAGTKLEVDIGSNPFSNPTDVLDELQRRPEAMQTMEGQLPRMELAFAVWLLLGLIRHTQKAVLTDRATRAKVD